MTAIRAWKGASGKVSVWFSLIVILAFGATAALAPWLAPHDPYEWELSQRNLPPRWVQDSPNPGTAEHFLGTDRFGRDILSRLLYGARTAFLLALFAVSAAAVIGSQVGLISGYAGGRLDAGIMLFTDMVSSLPGILFLVMIVLIARSMLPPTWRYGLATLVVGYAAVAWVSLARLVRVEALRIKSLAFMDAAKALGAAPWFIITHHLLPNVQHVILVWIINAIPAVILLEAVLGYIGVDVTSAEGGGEFTAVSWGGIFFTGRSAMSSNPLMLVVPSVCILLISMSFILLADFMNERRRREG